MKWPVTFLAAVFGTLTCLPVLIADEPALPLQPADMRYGLFNLFDHRSSYGQDVFPEPFLVDDSDLEDNEARLDWLHTEGDGQKSDVVVAEVEKGFGLLTLEIEVPFERDVADGDVSEGIGNIDLGARCPFYQFVSVGGLWDTTFGSGVELGIPTESAVSKNTELVPKVFNDTRIGKHFTAQSIFGYSALFGPGDDGGRQTFEYGFDFGWTFQHRELPLPGVLQVIPVFELAGETGLNKGESGQNSLLGNAAFRLNLKTIGTVQPRLGVGFVFPLDNHARTEVHHGVMVSLVFEY
ncbi:MAG: hypothetical protein ABSC24_03055 [Verrucomicrobiota bacterium]|jgi:hypothetical protein